MGFFSNFINGLRKSFDFNSSGEDYLREIHQCEKCGRPSFTNMCQYCETTEAYRKSEQRDNLIYNLIYNLIHNLVSMFFGRILKVAMSLKSCMGTCDVVALWASQGFVLSPFVALGTIVVGFVLRLISFFAF